jgi:hypothetical protein
MVKSCLLGAVGIVILVGARTLVAQNPATPTFEVVACQAAIRTTWDGVYTDAQAQRGEAIFNDTCAKCHGREGSGTSDATDPCHDMTPTTPSCALRGDRFMANWSSMTLQNLFDRVRWSMPQDKPQTLTRVDTTLLMAYLLRINGFPAGSIELPTDASLLNRLKYVR